MKSIASLKSTKNDSPKTPGGISKSLLTPCRRIGLSRNWKKAGPSPFISPISGDSPSNIDVENEKKPTRKRKKSVEQKETEQQSACSPETPTTSSDNVKVPDSHIPELTGHNEDLSNTPTRHVLIPRKKKSKTLLSALNKKELILEQQSSEMEPFKENLIVEEDNIKETKKVTTLTQKSQSKSKSIKINKNETTDCERELKRSHDIKEAKTNFNPKTKSPNELTKECMVVIQKKIFKSHKKEHQKVDPKSQVLFDSDSDDVPISELNKDEHIDLQPDKPASPKVQQIINLDDDDFIEIKSKVKKLEDKATSIGGLKKKPAKMNLTKILKAPVVPPSQISDFDDDEDFDFDNKKTILIRKTYEKVIKPQKARSTGSITQKDIDDLKTRIEAKKRILLARSMTEDTAELRNLIKKWQKGCQDALVELMDLMVKKFPDKQNMDYSEMLSMLKIPANLIGYDAENDCFTTPEDSNIILAKFNT